MNSIYETVIALSVTGSALALAVMLIRLLKVNFPKWVLLVLWTVVFINFIMPFKIPSPISIWNQASTQEVLSPVIPISENSENFDSNTNQISAITPSATGDTPHTKPFEITIPMVYFSITGLLLTAIAVLYYLTARRFKTTICTEKYGQIFYLSSRVNTPVVFGIFKPKIILPNTLDLGNEALIKHILLHESIHIKHRDNFWNLLSIIICCMHFFNPLVWVSRIFLNRDIESFCDECVIKKIGLERKKAYAQSLLTCAIHNTKPIPAIIVGFSENNVKRRIITISKYKKAGILTIITVLFVSLIAIALFATGAMQNNPSEVLNSTNSDNSGIEDPSSIPSSVTSSQESESEAPNQNTNSLTSRTQEKNESNSHPEESATPSTKDTSVSPEQIQSPAIPGKFVWPVPSVKTITSDYRDSGERIHKYINIGGTNAYGASVVAAMDGTVSKVVSGDEKLGNYIEIKHENSLSTIYATLGDMVVTVNQKITSGAEIAKIGTSGQSTGPNLHFEVRSNNTPVNPHLYLNN